MNGQNEMKTLDGWTKDLVKGYLGINLDSIVASLFGILIVSDEKYN